MKLLFVCLGNICRSPLAQAVCERELAAEGLAGAVKVESSGTSGYHVGEPSDSRMRRAAAEKGISINHLARHFRHEDFFEYDMIIAMDRSNYREILRAAGTGSDSKKHKEKVHMFRDYDPQGRGDVPDPYYGGPDGFRNVISIVERTCRQIVDDIRKMI